MPLFPWKSSLLAVLALLTATACQANETSGSDWPQWRGPTRDGIVPSDSWPSDTFPESLEEDRLKLSWRVELGPSYSGPIVTGDRVFTTETRDEATEVVTAYDRNSGKKLWSAEWPGAMTVPFFAASNGSWIRATPACDGESLFVAGIREELVSLDAATGKENWRVNFPERFGSTPPKFGCASSPIVDGDSVYAQYGGGAVRVNKQTGQVDWRVEIDGGGMSGGAFSSPLIATLDGKRTLLVQARQDLKGLDPQTGAVLWSQPIEAFRGMNIMTPTVYNNDLFTSAHTGRSQLWRLASTGATPVADSPVAENEAAETEGDGLDEVWSNKAQAYMSSPVIVGDHLYLHLRNQRIQCVDLTTGEEAWRTRPYGKYQSMAVLGDRILALDSDGELILFRATPDEYKAISTRKISEEETWAHIAVSGGQLFIRELNALAVYDWE